MYADEKTFQSVQLQTSTFDRGSNNPLKRHPEDLNIDGGLSNDDLESDKSDDNIDEDLPHALFLRTDKRVSTTQNKADKHSSLIPSGFKRRRNNKGS
jgi:hypothetical protein